MQSKFDWTYDETVVFLSILDAWICKHLFQFTGSRSFMEIGVYKGGWTLFMLRNSLDSQAFGIDPYPNLQHIRNELMNRIDAEKLGVRFRLLPDFSHFSSASEKENFGMVHVDGEHSEVACYRDLVNSFQSLGPNGIIVIDDIYHDDFPGVASATFKFVHSYEVAPFLITRSKMYLCRPAFFEQYFALTEDLLSRSHIAYSKGFPSTDFEQSNAIKGFRQLVVVHGKKQFSDFLLHNGLKPKPKSTLRHVKRVIGLFVPRIFFLIARKILRTVPRNDR